MAICSPLINEIKLEEVDDVDVKEEILQFDKEQLKKSLNIAKKPEQTPIKKIKKRRKSIWICKICMVEFPKKKDLANHKLQAHANAEKEVVKEVKYEYDPDQEVYVCVNCSAEFLHENEVMKHVETHDEKYECDECKETITGAYSFSKHAQTHRKDLMFPCPCCGHTAPKRAAMLYHINRMHLNKFKYQCTQCGKGYNDALYFKDHNNVHLGLKPFKCVVCGKEFAYSRYLSNHQLRQHTVEIKDKNSKNKCSKCRKTFMKTENLEKHFLEKHVNNTELNIKKHLCDVCGHGFARRFKLVVHYRKHSGEKPFSCSYCDKTFAKKDYLVMHERVHNGEKPYNCEFCDKTFNQSAPLRLHLRSHTGERPYICPYCNTGCISRVALKTHTNNCIGSMCLNNLEVELKEVEGVVAFGCTQKKEKKERAVRIKKEKIEKEEDDDDDYDPKKAKKVKKQSPRANKSPKKKKERVYEKSDKKLTCRKCMEEFDSRKELYDHGKTHQSEKHEDKHTFRYDEELDQYVCNTCLEEFPSQDSVEQHINKIHVEKFACETCNEVCDSVFKFALHLKTHTEGDSYSCPLCSYTCIRRAGLSTHINRVHYHKFYYYCKDCGKGFNDGVLYKEHGNEHLGIKPFICVVCNKDFVFSRYLLVHQVRYHTVHIEGILHKTQCSICMKVFSKVATLLKHITTKHNPNEDPNQRKHLCDMCGKGFGSSDKLKIHYRVHTGDKPFSCGFCGKSFTKKDYLVMHERVHTGEKPYSCEYCGKCFNQASSLRIHVRGHTGERPYICQFCSVGYISRGSLNIHMKICNGKLRKRTRKKQGLYESDTEYSSPIKKVKRRYNLDKTWSCKKCLDEFPTLKSLRAHRKIHIVQDTEEHTYKFDELQDLFICNTCCAEYQVKEEIEVHMKTHEEVYACKDCGEKFKTAYNYATHVIVHSDDKVFRCPLCSYNTAKRTGLLIHINYVHLKKFLYVCTKCGKGFHDAMLFKEHDNEHLGLRPFICIVCKKDFAYSRYLHTHQVRNHKVTIEGELLPNQCTICFKIFSKPVTLEKHTQKHLKNTPHEKKHLCDLCGKGFAQKNKLRVHYRVHTGDKPYTCSHCPKAFTKKDYLVMHERTHSGEKPYSCEFCGRCFSQGAPLRIHLRSHTGERPYVCQFCNAGFTSRGALNFHCKNCTGRL